MAARRRPFRVSKSRLNRNFPRDFFIVPIRRSAAFRNFPPARRHSRGIKQRRHQLRLPGAAVADNANVSNVLGEIALHTDLPLRGTGDAGANRRGPSRRIQARACAWVCDSEVDGERGPDAGVLQSEAPDQYVPLVRSPTPRMLAHELAWRQSRRRPLNGSSRAATFQETWDEFILISDRDRLLG